MVIEHTDKSLLLQEKYVTVLIILHRRGNSFENTGYLKTNCSNCAQRYSIFRNNNNFKNIFQTCVAFKMAFYTL